MECNLKNSERTAHGHSPKDHKIMFRKIGDNYKSVPKSSRPEFLDIWPDDELCCYCCIPTYHTTTYTVKILGNKGQVGGNGRNGGAGGAGGKRGDSFEAKVTVFDKISYGGFCDIKDSIVDLLTCRSE